MFRFLLLICVLVGSGFGCSCEPGSFARSRESVICDDFGDSANVFLATAQEAYCKCLPTEDDNQQFSCIKYNTGEDGFSNGETQETFSCGTNGERATFYYLECDAVTEEVGAFDVDPLVSPVTNLTECNFDTEPYDEGSGCDLTIQPCFYSLSVTRVYKGNYTVGSSITSPGPDVLTTCGEQGRVLRLGREYLVGIGGPCNSLSPWSQLDVYNPEDIQLLQSLANNSRFCDDSAAGTVLSSLAVSIVTVVLANFFI